MSDTPPWEQTPAPQTTSTPPWEQSTPTQASTPPWETQPDPDADKSWTQIAGEAAKNNPTNTLIQGLGADILEQFPAAVEAHVISAAKGIGQDLRQEPGFGWMKDHPIASTLVNAGMIGLPRTIQASEQELANLLPGTEYQQKWADTYLKTQDKLNGLLSSHFDKADEDLHLTPQEQYLYHYHLHNLHGPGKVNNPDGSISTIFQISTEINGKTYNIPTVWDGAKHSDEQAIAHAQAVGLSNFPTYPTWQDAEKRYEIMHTYMNKDVNDYQKNEPEILAEQSKLSQLDANRPSYREQLATNVIKVASETPEALGDPGKMWAATKTAGENLAGQTKEIVTHPKEGSAKFVGGVADPIYLVGGPEIKTGKALLDLFSKTTADAVVTAGAVGLGSVSSQVGQRGFATTKDTINDTLSALLPLTVIHGVLNVHSLGKDMTAGSGPLGSGKIPEHLNTATKVILNHLTTDEILNEVGNQVQKVPKDPNQPITMEEVLGQMDKTDPQAPLENNASGESAASMEAINRFQQEQTANQVRARITKEGDVIPLSQATDVDAKAGPGEVIVQHGIGAEPWSILDHNMPSKLGATRKIASVQDKLNVLTDQHETPSIEGIEVSEGTPEDAALFNIPKPQEGKFDPKLALALAGGTAGALYGYSQAGASGAFAGGALGALALPGLGMAARLTRHLLDKSPPLEEIDRGADLTKFHDQMNWANFAPYRLAMQLKRLSTPEERMRVNSALMGSLDKDELTPNELDHFNGARIAYDSYGEYLKGAGIIGELRNDYANRIFEPIPGSKLGANWQTRVSHGKMRTLLDGYAGIVQASEMGLRLRYNDYVDNLTMYAHEGLYSLTVQRILKTLLTDKLENMDHPWIQVASKAPKSYVPIGNTRQIRAVKRSIRQAEQARGVSPDKQTKIAEGESYKIHPDLAPYYNFLMDHPNPGTAMRMIQSLNYAIKHNLFSNNMFHAKTLAEHHLNMQPFGVLNPKGVRDIASVLAGTNPIFDKLVNGDPIVDKFIKKGISVQMPEDVGGESYYRRLDDLGTQINRMIPDWAQVNLPTKEAIAAKAAIDKFFDRYTWQRAFTGFRMIDALSLYARETARDSLRAAKDPNYRVRSDDEIVDGISSLVTNVYGGQDWFNLAKDARSQVMRNLKLKTLSATGRSRLQLGLMAPDWRISNFRALTHAIPGIATSKFKTRLHAYYIARSMAMYMVVANAVNMAYTGHSIFQNQDPTSIDLGNGRTILLDKAIVEPIEAIEHPRKSALGAMGPLLSEVLDQYTNQQYQSAFGRAPPIVTRGMSPVGAGLSRIGHGMSRFVPIPVHQAFTNPHTGSFDVSPESLTQATFGFMGLPIYYHKIAELP